MTGSEKIEYLKENHEDELLIGDGEEAIKLADAIIGVSSDGRVVYNRDLLTECFINRDGMTFEEAFEWIDYNIIRSLPYYPQDRVPIVVEPFEGN